MFLLFGWRTFIKNLAVVTAVCPRCNNTSPHRIVKRSRWFTLFFIPVIPLSIKTYSVCGTCGLTTQLDKASRESAMAAAVSQSPTGPIEPSPQIASLPDQGSDSAAS